MTSKTLNWISAMQPTNSCDGPILCKIGFSFKHFFSFEQQLYKLRYLGLHLSLYVSSPFGIYVIQLTDGYNAIIRVKMDFF